MERAGRRAAPGQQHRRRRRLAYRRAEARHRGAAAARARRPGTPRARPHRRQRRHRRGGALAGRAEPLPLLARRGAPLPPPRPRLAGRVDGALGRRRRLPAGRLAPARPQRPRRPHPRAVGRHDAVRRARRRADAGPRRPVLLGQHARAMGRRRRADAAGRARGDGRHRGRRPGSATVPRAGECGARVSRGVVPVDIAGHRDVLAAGERPAHVAADLRRVLRPQPAAEPVPAAVPRHARRAGRCHGDDHVAAHRHAGPRRTATLGRRHHLGRGPGPVLELPTRRLHALRSDRRSAVCYLRGA